MYYLVLVLVFTGYFLLVWLIVAYKRKQLLAPIVKAGALLIIIPLAICILTIRILDGYNNLRTGKAEGYDWIEWKLNFSALFTSYNYNKIKFLFESVGSPPYESVAYLGAFALFGALVFILLHFFGNRQTYSYRPLIDSERGLFLMLLGIGAVASLFIALGDYYYVAEGSYRFVNYLNSFFFLKKITSLVTQFRCLGRFNWIFFWWFNLVLLFLLDRSLKKDRSLSVKGIIAALALLAVIDLKDTLKHYKNSLFSNNLTNPKYIEEALSLAEGINPKEFQAILTIPYYHVGSEGDYSYTIDPDELISNTSMQLALNMGLPLMASKLARTPPVFAQLQFSTFTDTGIAEHLTKKMDNLPILVLYNKAYYNGSNNFYENLQRQSLRQIIENGRSLPEKYNMVEIKELGDWILYRWQFN